MAITFVIATSKQTTDKRTVTTTGVDTSGATLLVAWVANQGPSDSGPASVTLTDSKSNSWTTGPTSPTGVNTTPFMRCFYVQDPTGKVGSSHTFSIADPGVDHFVAIAVQAFSGTDITSAADQTNGAHGTTNTLQTGTVTPSANNEVVVTAFTGDSITPATINQSFILAPTPGLAFVSGTAYSIAAAYLIQTTATAQNPTWDATSDVSNSAVIATFKLGTTVTLVSSGLHERIIGRGIAKGVQR